jgi:L-amino acid N-acyltransferase YncA
LIYYYYKKYQKISEGFAMDLKLRLAKKEDLKSMLDIYAYYVRETVISFEYAPPEPAEFARRFETFTAVFPWIVCEADGVVLGYAYAHRFHDRAAYDWTAECTVYVKNGCQRRGIGRALYACLLDILRLQGFRMAVGVISVPNESSEALHRYFGFTKAGVIENAGYKMGAWRSTAWYVLPLLGYSGEPSPPLPIGKVTGTEAFGKIINRI